MHMVTGFPSSADDDTFAMPSLFIIRRPFSLAKRSTENASFMSVAVVMTGCAPVAAAISSASSFAPPTCPERTGITKLPCSSITMTGGSLSLSRTNGATVLTAIPAAPTKTSASPSLNALLHTSARTDPFGTMQTSCPASPSLTASAVFSPLFVKYSIFIVIISLPCGTQS